MTRQRRMVSTLLTAALGLALAAPAWAQVGSDAMTAPDYGSGAAAGALSDSNYNTPESDGRPGVKFFAYGVAAFKKGEYKHAGDMYKIAASWAYKPAEYNLGVMYFNGQGVPVNRSLGAAWMVLAAERGDPAYVKARDQMVTLLTNAQFAVTDTLWGQLRTTYGDKVALRRAKAQWAWVKSQKTGSRVGGEAGELSIGVMQGGRGPHLLNASGTAGKEATTGAQVMQGASISGSIAYRQFQQSDDPYSPVFLEKDRTGKATVGPLEQMKPSVPQRKSPPRGAAPASSGSPPRSA